MRSGEPSRTAFGAARHRAVHQVVEGGAVFTDPLALRILGVEADDLLDDDTAARRPLRLFIAVRHRFAEDSLAAAHARGVRQAVVLGAGLDTFAYRNPHADLAVWEVDHPDTGAWKRRRLAQSNIEVPDGVRFTGVDFERDDLRERLVADGLDPERPAFFVWLGVVPYLSPAAVRATLDVVAGLPGAEVVLDYPTRTASSDPDVRAVRDDLQRRTQAVGEPLLSAFDPEEMAVLLHEVGFTEVEDLGRTEFVPRYFGVPASGPSSGGGHVVRARR